MNARGSSDEGKHGDPGERIDRGILKGRFSKADNERDDLPGHILARTRQLMRVLLDANVPLNGWQADRPMAREREEVLRAVGKGCLHGCITPSLMLFGDGSDRSISPPASAATRTRPAGPSAVRFSACC
jgi:hypothetical protein